MIYATHYGPKGNALAQNRLPSISSSLYDQDLTLASSWQLHPIEGLYYDNNASDTATYIIELLNGDRIHPSSARLVCIILYHSFHLQTPGKRTT